MIEHGVVFAIVAVATGYAVWKLMPRVLRQRLAAALVQAATGRGRMSHERTAHWQRRLAGGDCGVCESCGGCASKSTASSAPDGATGSATQLGHARPPN